MWTECELCVCGVGGGERGPVQQDLLAPLSVPWMSSSEVRLPLSSGGGGRPAQEAL